MAENTGIPEIDSVIEAWVSSDPVIVSGIPGYQRIRRDAKLSELRDPEIARGRCSWVTDQLVEHLEARGIDAWQSDMPSKRGGAVPSFFSPEQLGYDDRKTAPGNELDALGEHGAHSVVLVRVDRVIYSIDFSAAQYGYEQFPLVQRLGPEGRWEREWQPRPQLARDHVVLAHARDAAGGTIEL